jgi:hypothetical protein
VLSRDRTMWSWRQGPFRLLIFEPLHAYMQTGVLLGIKRRAERTREAAMARDTGGFLRSAAWVRVLRGGGGSDVVSLPGTMGATAYADVRASERTCHAQATSVGPNATR